MSTDGEDFLLTNESLADLWALACKQEIGITFQIDPKHSGWLRQKLYQIRKDLAIPEYDEIIVHINADQETIMMYKRVAKDALT